MLEPMAREYGPKGFHFLFVYTREAHPGEHYDPHRNMEQKLTHARVFKERGQVERPILVDDLVGTGHKLYGALPNMMWAALYGMIFGLIAYGTHLKGAVAVISGLIYGVLVMLFMSFVIASIVGAPNILNLLGWPTWTIGHLLFGLVLGFWPVLRSQDFTSLVGQQVRRVA